MSYQFSSDPKLSFSPVCRGLFIANTAVFVLGVLGLTLGIPLFDPETLFSLFGLSSRALLREGMIWVPFTYMFLHANLLHLGANMMGLYLLGPDLEQALGHVRFLCFYVISGLVGAVGYLLITVGIFGQPTPVIGASGAVFGLLGGAVALYPNRTYVILPLMIPMKASVLAVLLLTSHIFFIVTPYGNAVAYDVHLGGGLAGFALTWCAAWWHRRSVRPELPDPEIPYARVELETLTYRLAAIPDSPETEWKRYLELRNLLRFEDIPSVDELSARRKKS